MNLKYLQVSFGMRERLPIDDKSRGGGLKAPCNLEK